MRAVGRSALRLLGFALGLLAGAQGHAEMDRETFIGLSNSVLKIEVIRAQGGYSLGSGVVVDAEKVVTNCHVTRDGREIYVLRSGGRWRAESQASDTERDLCVLHVPGIRSGAVALGRAADLKIGQPVVAIGYTGGVGMQNSGGEVVALHRHAGSSVVRSSNWFNSGASGGGLFDDDLRLVGILTFRLRGGAAHYFSAPVDWVRELLADRARFKEVKPLDPRSLAYWQKPVEAQPNFLKASVLERDRKWADLQSLANDWSRSAANDPEPWYLQGLALDSLDRLADAQQAFERSVAIEPAFSEAWFRLGMVAMRLGLLDRARQARGRLLELKSELAVELSKAIDKF